MSISYYIISNGYHSPQPRNKLINYYPVSIAPKLLFAIWAPPRKRKVFFFWSVLEKKNPSGVASNFEVDLSCRHSVRVEVAGHPFISDATKETIVE